MYLRILFVTLLINLVTMLVIPSDSLAATATDQVNDRRVIIKVKDNQHFDADAWGVREITSEQLLSDQYSLVRIPDDVDYSRKLSEIQQAANVQVAEPDYIRKKTFIPSDADYDEQWYLDRIQMPKAWDIEKGSPDVTIAVLDTGIDADHPELNGRVLPGYDFVNNDRHPDDDNGHGTSLAGVIAANADGQGITGIDLYANLLPVKIANEAGDASVYNILEGIQYAIEHDADVINMSFVSYQFSKLEEKAIQDAYEAGIVQVAAAGNKGISDQGYPAAYPPVIGVAATDKEGSNASFSNYGNAVDVTAPGKDIYNVYKEDGYAIYSGTSYAAPIVSGIAGLLRASHPEWTNDQMKKALEASAVSPDKAEWSTHFGYGQVNAYRALTIEPDDWDGDAPDQQAQATALTFDHTITEKIYHSVDTDWYRFEVDKPTKVTIELTNPSDTLDLTAELMDADTRLATIDKEDAGGEEHYTFTAEAGTYYLNVNDKHHRWSDVPYKLSISASFPDVERYTKEINYLTQKGIINGYPDGTFQPGQNVTRLQAVQMILSEMGIAVDQANVTDPGFTDVTPDTYGYNAIAKAAELGFINGKKDGSFDPSGNLTRGQMAAILVSAYDLAGTYGESFSDVPDDHWAHDKVDILAANGMTTGYPDQTFRPAQPISREHFSLFLYNYLTENK
ncbi:S8 family serine peptidase [Lentibacillus cibarius]|uniref:SLH domain-containing protein n=1 Tax=Lentibacillus cibarius TaxID=2583219 RepID=A0A5S3QMS3_9BACI|nr:S8 family serine peptidase [Lentibacillus cibarius]TMN21776.1 hypothetical protein FFL34_06375 [Lentibacillus cibarius]